MASADYAPGGWFGIVRSETAVILGPESQPALVRNIWDLLGGAPEVHEVLHAVTGGLGVPLPRLPRFGIISFRGSLRVFLRGDLQLNVQLPTGPVQLDGRNVTTWTERLLDSPQAFTLTAPGSEQDLPVRNFSGQDLPGRDFAIPDTGLPVTEGVVLLQALRAHLAGPGSTGLPASSTEASREASPAASTRALPDVLQEVSPETIAGPPETTSEGVSLGAAALDVPALHTTDPAALPATVRDGTAADQPTPDEGDDTAEPSPAASDVTGSYDHLWDKTVMRSIEDAAVRTGEDPGEGPGTAGLGGAGREPAGAVAPTDPDPKPGPDPAAPASTPSPASTPGPVRRPTPPGPAAPPTVPAPAGGLIDGGLIDSVPWSTAGDSGPRPSAPPSFISVPDLGKGPDPIPTPVPIPTPGPVPTPDLIQGTAGIPQPGLKMPQPAEGDHDGQTVLKSDLKAASGTPDAEGAARGGGTLTGLPAGPLVLARVCPAGHASPPTSGRCSTCGSHLPDVAVQVPRPRLGRIRLSTGEVIELEESLVIGRQPSVSRVQGGAMPRLVQVASPGGDISRSHVEIRLEGWHVMLCDLKATNGTVLVREGQPPRRLAQNEMAIVLDGDIAELGDDVSLRFEEIL